MGLTLKADDYGPKNIQSLVRFVCKSLSDFGKPFSISILDLEDFWV